MKKIKVLALSFLAIAFLSCQNKEVKEPKEVHTEKVTPETTKEELPKVSLNNGQLWEANPETTEGIKTLQKIVSDNKPEESAVVLKEKLEAEFASIFKKCTMKGEAHDQLHNYLFPLKMKLNRIEETNREAIKKEIAAYLEEYALYFK